MRCGLAACWDVGPGLRPGSAAAASRSGTAAPPRPSPLTPRPPCRPPGVRHAAAHARHGARRLAARRAPPAVGAGGRAAGGVAGGPDGRRAGCAWGREGGPAACTGLACKLQRHVRGAISPGAHARCGRRAGATGWGAGTAVRGWQGPAAWATGRRPRPCIWEGRDPSAAPPPRRPALPPRRGQEHVSGGCLGAAAPASAAVPAASLRAPIAAYAVAPVRSPSSSAPHPLHRPAPSPCPRPCPSCQLRHGLLPAAEHGRAARAVQPRAAHHHRLPAGAGRRAAVRAGGCGVTRCEGV